MITSDDLKRMDEEVDRVLKKETKASLMVWLNMYRFKQFLKNQKK